MSPVCARALRFFTLVFLVGQSTFAFAQPGGMEMPPPPVETTSVVRAPLFLTISAVGSLAANESATLRPEIDGQIVNIAFEEGQPVKAGEPLILLDQAIVSAEVKSAVSSANLGDANLRRAQELKRAGYATQRSLDEAKTEATSNISAAAVAKVRLDKTIVRAPFDGVAGFRTVSLGDFVRAGDALMNFEQIDVLKATFQLPEVFLPAVQVGVPVEIRVDAYPNEVFAGQIIAINPAIDRQTRSIAIRARVPNADGRLRPGLFARVSIPYDQNQKVLQVPETALVPQGNKMLAFRVKDGVAQQVEVQMGQRNDGRVEVVSGLAEGDEVVVTGQMRVQDGGKVNVVNRLSPAVPAAVPTMTPAAAPTVSPTATPAAAAEPMIEIAPTTGPALLREEPTTAGETLESSQP